MRITTLNIFCVLLAVSGVLIQTQCVGQSFGKHRFLTSEGTARLPFPANLDHVIITAHINGKGDIRLILDTGMPMPGVILLGRGNESRWGMTSEQQSVTLGFPGLELTEVPAMLEPSNGPLTSMLKGVDGIIGLEIFGQTAATIDYDQLEVVLEEPEAFQVPAGATELPLVIKGGFPWLACSAVMASGTVVPLDLVVDLGASHALSLNVGTNENIVPPDNAIETILGKTISGAIYGKVGRIRNLRLGNLILKDVITSFQTGERHGPSAMEKEGNLGNDALRRFNVTFDYKKSRMVLAPNSHFSDQFEYNMTGIEYLPTPEGDLKVDRILPGSPAAQAKLKTGDIISEVNGRPVSAISKDDLKRILRKDGGAVELSIIVPDSGPRKVTLTLHRII